MAQNIPQYKAAVIKSCLTALVIQLIQEQYKDGKKTLPGVLMANSQYTEVIVLNVVNGMNKGIIQVCTAPIVSLQVTSLVAVIQAERSYQLQLHIEFCSI